MTTDQHENKQEQEEVTIAYELGIDREREEELEEACLAAYEGLGESFTQVGLIQATHEALTVAAATEDEIVYCMFQVGFMLGNKDAMRKLGPLAAIIGR